MSKELTLVVLAAGMGSRFGGLKQVSPVDGAGHIIIDFSVYDALKAGFSRIVFVIRRENEEAFRSTVGSRFEKIADVRYAYQELSDIPSGFAVPDGRTKPWGTGHAVYAARREIVSDFAVINSDDFYGRGAYFTAAAHLNEENGRHAMIAYRLSNTLTENGSVNRGICRAGDNGDLLEVVERLGIVKAPGGAVCRDGAGSEFLPDDAIVSMNMWAFRRDILEDTQASLAEFLERDVPANPLKAEFYLPRIVNGIMAGRPGCVRLLTTEEKWYGVTYREDLPSVRDAIAEMEAKGVYPAGF